MINGYAAGAINALTPVLKVAVKAIPLRLTAYKASVVTYHACFSTCPPGVDPVDNITPEQLYAQVAELKKRYTLVSIDELAAASNRRGLAAITFDDGYRSVIDHALPVLQSLGAPFTVFVNTASLDRKTFWRHKVVHIINTGLSAECERTFIHTRPVAGETFHTYLKNPRNHSAVAEDEIDRFLAHRGIELPQWDYLVARESEMIRHPLLFWGNHSHNHYVLSSLSVTEQRQEIGRTHEILARSSGNTSSVFSLPFGETRHFNEHTCIALRDYGYSVMLMNRGGMNAQSLKKQYGITVLERFSPAAQDFQSQLRTQYCRSIMMPAGPSHAYS